MRHKLVVFRLHRRGVLALGCLGVLLAVLSFAAGWLLALRPRLEEARAPASEPAPGGTAPSPASGEAAPGPAATGQAGQDAAPPAPGEGSLPPTQFSIQLASYAFEAEAKDFAESLSQQGFEPLVLTEPGAGDRHLYRVVVGSYATRQEAAEAAAALGDELDRRAVVVETRLPKAGPPTS